MNRCLAALVGIVLLAPNVARAAPPSWDPKHTWLFAVGLLKWEHPDVWAPFPDAEKNRADVQLVEFFKKRGVPKEQIVYLKDEKATLKNIRQRLAEFVVKPGEEDLLLVYFAGHGHWEVEKNRYYFVNYEAHKQDCSDHWPVASLCSTLENKFEGGRLLLLADCCHSGGLALEVRKREWECPMACLTSTFAHNLSTGSWTFTESVLKAFHGNPMLDLDGDGQVDLDELARYVERTMAFFHGQRPVFLTRQDFNPRMVLAKTAGKRDAKAGQHVEVLYPEDRKWYRAEVVRQTTKGPEVKYPGYEELEIVTDAKRLRAYQPQTIARGSRVRVKWTDGQRYPAIVKDSWYGLVFVHYEDYGDEYNDWVPVKDVAKR